MRATKQQHFGPTNPMDPVLTPVYYWVVEGPAQCLIPIFRRGQAGSTERVVVGSVGGWQVDCDG